MNTIENNKLIAEFMGYKLHDLGDGNSPYYNHSDKYIKPKAIIRLDKGEKLEFDTSWDWLMPVVEKIESLGFCTSIRVNKYTNSTTVCTIEDKNEATIGGGLSQILVTEGFKKQTKFEAVYNAVIEFVEWHNSKKA